MIEVLTNLRHRLMRPDCAGWLTALLLLSAFFIRIIFFTGCIGSDDVRYWRYAKELLAFDYSGSYDHAASRSLFLLLIGWPSIFSSELASGVMVNIGFASVTDILTVWLARRWISPLAGLMTAGLVAFNGLQLVYASMLLPDTILSLCVLGSAALLFHARSANGKPQFRAIAFAGLCAGCAYLIKDTGIVILPAAILFLWFDTKGMFLRIRLNAITIFLSCALSAWLCEGLIHLLWTGDFLYRVHALSKVHNASMGQASSVYDFVRRGYWNATLIFTLRDTLLLPACLAAVSWPYAVLTRSRYAVFALFGVSLVLYSFFGSSSLTRLVNLPFQERYAQPWIPLMALTFCYALDRLFRNQESKYMLVSAVLFFLSMLLGILSSMDRAGGLYDAATMRNASIAVLSVPRQIKTIYTEGDISQYLASFLPPDQMERLQPMPENGALPPGYYLVVGQRSERLRNTLTDHGALVSPYLRVAIDQKVIRRFGRFQENNAQSLVEIYNYMPENLMAP